MEYKNIPYEEPDGLRTMCASLNKRRRDIRWSLLSPCGEISKYLDLRPLEEFTGCVVGQSLNAACKCDDDPAITPLDYMIRCYDDTFTLRCRICTVKEMLFNVYQSMVNRTPVSIDSINWVLESVMRCDCKDDYCVNVPLRKTFKQHDEWGVIFYCAPTDKENK